MNSIEKSAVVFVVPGDLHLMKPGLENHRVATQAVDEINTSESFSFNTIIRIRYGKISWDQASIGGGRWFSPRG